MPSKPAHLKIYSREGCYLCEDMLDALHAYQDELSFEMTVYNIDEDGLLLDRYNECVPIVFIDDREVMRYYFELATLKQALAELA